MKAPHRTKWHLLLACQYLYLCRCLLLVGLNADLSAREKQESCSASETMLAQADTWMLWCLQIYIRSLTRMGPECLKKSAMSGRVAFSVRPVI